jgi:hypothetical protein
VLSRLPLQQQEEIINNAMVNHSPALYQLSASPERVREDLEELSREYGVEIAPLLDSPLLVPQKERSWQPEILASRRSEDGRTLEMDVSLPEGVKAHEIVHALAEKDDIGLFEPFPEQQQEEAKQPHSQPRSQIQDATPPEPALSEQQQAALATPAVAR